MGWCSATEIMDTALDAAEQYLTKAYELMGVDPERVTLDDVRPGLDAVLAPFVTTLAEMLRNNDWDCVDESRYFDRFPQEMLGLNDSEFRAWLVARVAATDGDEEWVSRLAAFIERTKVNGG